MLTITPYITNMDNSSDSTILSEEERYLYTKSDADQGRDAEVILYESMALERFRREAQVYVGNHTMKWAGACFRDCRVGVYPVRNTEADPILIQYYDADNELQTLASSYYSIMPSDRSTAIVFGNGLPSVYDRPDAVQMTFKVGYSAAEVPALIKQAVVQQVAYWFDKPAEANKRFQTTFDYVIDIMRLTWV